MSFNWCLRLLRDRRQVPWWAKTVVVDGTIPEAEKGKTPDSIRYRSITEEQSK